MHGLWHSLEEERNQGLWAGRDQLQGQRVLQERLISFELFVGKLGFVFIGLEIVRFEVFGFEVIVIFIGFVIVEVIEFVGLAPDDENASVANRVGNQTNIAFE